VAEALGLGALVLSEGEGEGEGVVAGGGVGVGSAVGADEQPTAADRTRATKPSHGSFIAQ
jgi:hypothetical protein